MAYGRKVLLNTGTKRKVLATPGPSSDWFPIGETVDWGTVAALGADTTTIDSLVLKAGSKYLRAGQVMCKISSMPTQTVTVTATGGSFALQGNRLDNNAYVVSPLFAYNASAATVAAALNDPSMFGPGANVTVALAGGVYTITGNIGSLSVINNTATGGTIVWTAGTAVANAGFYGPYDPAASDGRQSLVRGNCGVLNQSHYQSNPYGGLSVLDDDHGALLVGGLWHKGLVLMTTGVHSLAAGPTVAEVEAAFPMAVWAPTAP